jgi:hypothetical protein
VSVDERERRNRRRKLSTTLEDASYSAKDTTNSPFAMK